ncbi:23S rRNA accumulation protein YceD [Idiomarina seosinensis]|uniref:23S rRNA accumulation protein YceD n=1 Tax=Idiomarina seosinensis TaxID=281739 RepID=UPI00384FFC30
MQKVRIPVTADPVKSANKKQTFDGLVPATRLTRFQGMLAETSHQDLEVEVKFAVDEQGISYFSGTAKTAVKLTCQRCNQPFPVDISTRFAYAPVSSEQDLEELPERYEGVEVNEFGEVNLHGLIEDELILALPLVARHEPKDCPVDRDAMTWGEIDEGSDESSENPFSVLQELKRK